MALNRRRLLQVGFGGAALLAVGGVGLGLRPSVPRVPARPLRALDPRAFSVLAAVADRLCPGDGELPPARELQVAEQIDALMATLHPGDAKDLGAALLLVENALAGLVFDRRFTTFTGSPPELQDRVLAALQTSALSVRRQIYRSVHGLVMGAYWSQSAAWRFSGYPGPPDYGFRGDGSASRPPIERRPVEPPGPLADPPEETP